MNTTPTWIVTSIVVHSQALLELRWLSETGYCGFIFASSCIQLSLGLLVRFRLLALLAAIAAFASYIGIGEVSRPESMPPIDLALTRKVLIVQSEHTLSSRQGDLTASKLVQVTQTAGEHIDNLGIIIWPEDSVKLRFSVGDVAQDRRLQSFVGRVRQIAVAPVMFGAVMKVERVENKYGVPFVKFDVGNYAFCSLKNGSVWSYRKRVLVPFAESLRITAGAGGVPIRVGGVPFAVTICYESFWPSLIPQEHEGNLVCVHLLNDSWFTAPLLQRELALRHLRLRAFQTRAWQLVCSTSHTSCVISPAARVVVPPSSGERVILFPDMQSVEVDHAE